MIDRISPRKAGLALAGVMAGWHLCWLVLVAAGLAQRLIDFILWMHFIKPVYVVEAHMASPNPDRRSRRTLAALLALAVSFLASAECAAAWKVEEGVTEPSYAVTEPASSNLNIDTVALMCEAADDATILQLKIYLADDGPLRPDGVAAERLKVDPRAEISVDGRVFPVSLLFADEYVVLADSGHGRFPALSDALLDAMVSGKRMLVRFDLVSEQPGPPPAFDGEAVIALGSAAISAVRRCARPPAALSGGMAFAGQ